MPQYRLCDNDTRPWSQQSMSPPGVCPLARQPPAPASVPADHLSSDLSFHQSSLFFIFYRFNDQRPFMVEKSSINLIVLPYPDMHCDSKHRCSAYLLVTYKLNCLSRGDNCLGSLKANPLVGVEFHSVFLGYQCLLRSVFIPDSQSHPMNAMYLRIELVNSPLYHALGSKLLTSTMRRGCIQQEIAPE